MTDSEIEALAHRKAAIYVHDSRNPNESSFARYTFDRHTLLDFARSIAAGAAAATEGVKELRAKFKPPEPVYFEFDKKKPKPDGFAAYTVMQLHAAFDAGLFAASPSMGSAGAMQQPVAFVDPTDPGWDVKVLREHVRHLERRIRELHAASPLGASAGDAGARMLTRDEFMAAYQASDRTDGGINAAIQRKFCEVNGIRLAVDAQQSDSVHSAAPGADVGKTLENAPGAGGSVE